jgi:hypothetical protein
MTNPDTLAGGVKLEAKAIAAAEAAYSRTCGGITEGRPMANAITAYLAALPATGAPVNDDMVDAAQAVLLKYVEDRAAIRHALVAALATIPSGGEPEPVEEGTTAFDYFVEAQLDRLASPPKPSEAMVATHRHVKRGTEYVLIGYGKMQAGDWHQAATRFLPECPVDGREVAIYRSVDDGSLWVRPREEFEDGRFIALTAALSGGAK